MPLLQTEGPLVDAGNVGQVLAVGWTAIGANLCDKAKTGAETCTAGEGLMDVSLLKKSAANRIRRFPVRCDIVDASCYLEGAMAAMVANGKGQAIQVFVSVRLVNQLKQLGTQEGIEKLRQVVNRGMAVMRHNNGNKKSNFVVDLIPTEFYMVERYYGEQVPSIVIDCEPLQAAERLRGNG